MASLGTPAATIRCCTAVMAAAAAPCAPLAVDARSSAPMVTKATSGTAFTSPSPCTTTVGTGEAGGACAAAVTADRTSAPKDRRAMCLIAAPRRK